MKPEFEKNMLIAGELLSYCHIRGASEYSLDIKAEGGGVTFTMKASPVAVTPEQLERLRRRLNAPRQREIEQGFWALSGESENTSELMLVGMMCDGAKVEYDGSAIVITLVRLA